MAKSARLTALFVKTAKAPGRYGDGNNLYLVVDGGKRWLFRYRLKGRSRDMGLGSYPAVSLERARKLAGEAKSLIAEGIDPIDHRKLQDGSVVTFGEVAEQYIASKEAGWRNEKHRQQWRNTIATYADKLRNRPVADITVEDVHLVLKPIWLEKSETASRLRGRIENILDAAKAQGLRAGENPAAWRGNLAHLLPKRNKLTRGHQRALPYESMPDFWWELCKRTGVAPLALRFAILTAARTGEVLGARWTEIDLANGVWTVPAARMKAGAEHRVPLSRAALEILGEMSGHRVDVIFPGGAKGGGLSSAAMSAVLRRMKADATVHGFRSTFRDWAGDQTEHSREVVEAALAHKIGSAVERSYRRRDALDKRRKLLTDWQNYLTSHAV